MHKREATNSKPQSIPSPYYTYTVTHTNIHKSHVNKLFSTRLHCHVGASSCGSQRSSEWRCLQRAARARGKLLVETLKRDAVRALRESSSAEFAQLHSRSAFAETSILTRLQIAADKCEMLRQLLVRKARAAFDDGSAALELLLKDNHDAFTQALAQSRSKQKM